jgi:hypothetical protein
MNHITDTFFVAHAFELRLLAAVMVLPVTYAVIEFTSFIARSAGSILAKANSIGANNVSTAAYSAAGAR